MMLWRRHACPVAVCTETCRLHSKRESPPLRDSCQLGKLQRRARQPSLCVPCFLCVLCVVVSSSASNRGPSLKVHHSEYFASMTKHDKKSCAETRIPVVENKSTVTVTVTVGHVFRTSDGSVTAVVEDGDPDGQTCLPPNSFSNPSHLLRGMYSQQDRSPWTSFSDQNSPWLTHSQRSNSPAFDTTLRLPGPTSTNYRGSSPPPSTNLRPATITGPSHNQSLTIVESCFKFLVTFCKNQMF
jgi:hypothetical protein